jgi:DNA-binding CsgD family transcriptional regulator
VPREAADLLGDPTAQAITLTAAALAHAQDGHLEVARSEAQQALALFDRLQWRSGVVWPPDEIEALIALGEVERADSVLERFEARAQTLDRAWALAAASRYRAMLHAARGDREAALAAFKRALDEHGRTKMPIERARTLLAAGQVYRRFKQRGLAREALQEALGISETVGAPSWAARAQSELGRLGGPSLTMTLTPTERRAAELVASGLSNQEVAERAFLSPKTVEANLTRVYRKLGVEIPRKPGQRAAGSRRLGRRVNRRVSPFPLWDVPLTLGGDGQQTSHRLRRGMPVAGRARRRPSGG